MRFARLAYRAASDGVRVDSFVLGGASVADRPGRFPLPQLLHLDGDHVRLGTTHLLLNEGVITVRHLTVQSVADFDTPPLVEVVEQTGLSAGPIVDRHGGSSGQRIVPQAGVARHPAWTRGWGSASAPAAAVRRTHASDADSTAENRHQTDVKA